MKLISAADLRALFDAGEEFAVIDPREEALFARGHLLCAANLPMSRFELTIGTAVPRRNTPIVLCDDCDGTAARADHILGRRGYRNVVGLAGGNGAWCADGGALFPGLNVPGRVFAEHVAWSSATPSISARGLAERLFADMPTQLLDCRTPDEHRTYCLPGALNCPGGELVLRAQEPLDIETLVVPHCGGRARSILAAQTLIEEGFECPVAALENGAVAWQLAGQSLERGADRLLGWPDARNLRAARMKAIGIASRHAVAAIDRETLASWLADTERTTYLIDVRMRAEYDLGHVAGARWVSGGELVHAADAHLVTRNARIVLIDTEKVRAPVTGSWLRRMGYRDVVSYTAGPDDLRAQDAVGSPSAAVHGVETVDAYALQVEVEHQGVTIVDVRKSADYRRGHIAGAWYLTRENLYRDAGNLPGGSLAMVADDLEYGALVAGDLERIGRRIRLLEGGMNAWRAADGAVERGLSRLASPPLDTWFGPRDFDNPRVAARELRARLNGEMALLDQLYGDPAAPYTDPSFST